MRTIAAFASMSVVLSCAFSALAAPVYDIVPLGLTDAEHTLSNGYRYSIAQQLNEAGNVRGYSERQNSGGRSAWLYNGATTINIGLTGSEHTRSDGYKYSISQQLNGSGQVRGYSERYIGGVGRSAWLYDGGATTINIGLTGSEHTRNDGYKYSEALQLNQAGQVAGFSDRYNGGGGRSAWLYDGLATIDVGLADSGHTRNDGYSYSAAQALNEAGQVLGRATRFHNGYNKSGQTAWLYNGATTINIGLVGSEHTDNIGYKYSDAYQLNEAGQVIGYSNRYAGGGGRSAWLYNGTATIDIGLTGTEHTRSNGYRFSNALRLNAAGHVIGHADRYSGNLVLGRSVWLYDGETTIEIGLTDSQHTGRNGYRYNESAAIGTDLPAKVLNETGQLIGYARHYHDGSSAFGYSAWLYNGETTIEIGLTDSEHTGTNGRKNNFPQQINEAGEVIGHSNRFRDGGGNSIWLYNGTTTIKIGLTGSEHTSIHGHKSSYAKYLNDAGQVIGWSERYNGSHTNVGRDAWVYDPTFNQTIPLRLSKRSDGYAYSTVEYLGEDGLVLGSYTLFDASDNVLGSRAFYFTGANGLHDLGLFVDGGLAANGWDKLANAIRANGLGEIIGHGTLAYQSANQMAYLLTPVPEPSSAVLGGMAMMMVSIMVSSARGRRLVGRRCT